MPIENLQDHKLLTQLEYIALSNPARRRGKVKVELDHAPSHPSAAETV